MLAYFAFTLFVSATLLFLVQPLVGKMILPRLGGTPAVWNTCMVFFQAVLLVGYAYTHTITSWQSRRRQLLVQLVIVILPLAFFVLPFSLGDWNPPSESNPVFSVLYLLLGMVGLPFFVVSTSAPLLQRWFGMTGHPAAKDPYFLYGASNLGSILGLLAYPLAFEPAFDVDTQAWVWTGGYVLFAVLVAGCIAVVWRQPEPLLLADQPVAPPPEVAPVKVETAITVKRGVRRRATAQANASALAAEPSTPSPAVAPVTWLRRLRWVALAAAPSSLMLGLTTEMTTDIAAIPFFWVIPLALYLLTFILVFARWPVVWTEGPHNFVLVFQPCALLFIVLLRVANLSLNAFVQIGFHIMAFVTTTLMCHGELAKDRPSARHLTEFYLAMSIGGVLGGTFNALLAPVAFPHGVVEYWVAFLVACCCRPSLVGEFTLIPGDTDKDRTTTLGRILDFVIPLALGGLSYGFLFIVLEYALRRDLDFPKRQYLMVVPVILLLTLSRRPLRFTLSLALLLLVTWWHDL
ncbi:MAG: hypothetical protein NZO58_13460, partial [Gemmataceae bacterium]|nr:hypothetical protein [Gemmataceae bacterium]